MLLTEDGHLDCEKVRKLNLEELNKEMNSWNYELSEEYRIYMENLPLTEGSQNVEDNGPVEFDGTLDEFFERFC